MTRTESPLVTPRLFVFCFCLAPLRHWLRYDLRPVVDDVLSEPSIARRGLFDPQGVRRMVEMDRDRKLDASYTIFSLICIELWCRMFIDPPTPALV